MALFRDRAQRAYWLLLISLAACSTEDERPPYLSDPGVPSGGRTQVGSGGNTQAGAGQGGVAQGGEGGSTVNGAWIYNPNSVYMFGSMDNQSTKRAIARWDDPNNALVGFDVLAENPELSVSRLLYLSNGAIFEHRAEFWGSIRDLMYPTNPEANDLTIATTPCTQGVNKFFTSPAGRIIYKCEDGNWYEVGQTQLVYSGPVDIIKVADADLVAIADGANFGVMSLKDLEPHTVADLGRVDAARSNPKGFHFAAWNASLDVYELWEVDPAGAGTKLGVYPAYADTIQRTSGHTLTPDDSLFLIGESDASPDDVIVRLKVGGTSGEVVYNENSDPAVKLYNSVLFSGP